MTDEPRGGACVICGKKIDGYRCDLLTESEQHPERTYHFFVHPACLKKVAKPGFAGLRDL